MVDGFGLRHHGDEGMNIGLLLGSVVKLGLITTGHAIDFKFFELFERMFCVHKASNRLNVFVNGYL